jgi:hypothetical protein
MIPLLAAILTLETDTTSIGFDTARNGAIVALVDKASKCNLAAAQATAPRLYELQFDDAPTLTETNSVTVNCRREGNVVIISADSHRPRPRTGGGVSVECRFRVERGSPLILATIAVRNNTGHALIKVRFPSLTWSKQVGTAPEREFLLLPRNDGCVVPSPATARSLPSCGYPGNASMQLVAHYGDTAGVYVAAHDNRGFTKEFGVEKDGDFFRLALLHLPALVPRGDWRTEYDVAIGTFRGDWQTAADIYKTWALKQPWCSRTLAQRIASGDVPRWLIEPSLFCAYCLNGEIAGEKSENRIPLVPGHAAAWSDLLGAPTTMMLMHWEKLGGWVGPDYFPPRGGEGDFKAMTATLHSQGHRTLAFLSGLKWVPLGQANETTFEQRGLPSAICKTVDKPQYIDSPHRSLQICPGTPLAREILLGSVLGCQRIGIDCVQGDQIVGGGMPPCYSTKHGHPTGGGNWEAVAMWKLFDEIRREGKKRDPKFAWSVEEPCEFFIPVLDTYHARDYQQRRWPRNKGVIGVPLFTHVYHQFMHGYGGETVNVWPSANREALYEQGMNLVCGKTPDVSVWKRDYNPKTTHATQVRLLRSHLELWRGPAREYLVFGERVASRPLNVPTMTCKFFAEPGEPKGEIDLPVVLHSVWRQANGRVGTVFVCVNNKAVAFDALGEKITLEPGEVRFIERGSQ